MAESGDGGKTFGPRRLVSSDAGAGTPVVLEDLHTCLFATTGNSISVGGGQTARTIENATLPAATASAGKIVAAFVREEGGKRAVWLAAMPAG